MTETNPNVLRRRWERFAVELNVKVSILQAGDSLVFHCTGTDIGLGGLSVFVPRDLNAGQGLNMELAIPYSQKGLALRGVVRNRSGFNYGVEFVGITAKEQETLARACRALKLLK